MKVCLYHLPKTFQLCFMFMLSCERRLEDTVQLFNKEKKIQ